MKNNTLDRWPIRFFTKAVMAILFLGAVAFAHPLLAQTTWTGATSDDWNTASNWDTGMVPTSTDEANIPNTATAPVIKNGTAAKVQWIGLSGGGQLDIENGASLVVDGDDNTYGIELIHGSVNNYGSIDISNVSYIGIDFDDNSHLKNFGYITIESPYYGYGIFMDSYSNNSLSNEACGEIYVNGRVEMEEDFTNNGFFFCSSDYSNGTFTNNGVANILGKLSFPQSLINNGVYVNTTEFPLCYTNISPAIDIAANGSHTIEGLYLDSLATSPTTAYAPATNTFTPSSPFGANFDTTFYVKIIDNTNGCTIPIVKWNMEASRETEWTGAVDNDWGNDDNWTRCVPDANTAATIPDPTNYPVIKNGTVAEALSVLIEQDGQLDIESGASLTIYPQSYFHGIRNNQGTVNNHGTILLHKNGLYSGDLYNSNGHFTNYGSIICHNDIGIWDYSAPKEPFINEACGEIIIHGRLQNYSGHIINNGYLSAGRIENDEEFTNNGILNIVDDNFKVDSNNGVIVRAQFVANCPSPSFTPIIGSTGNFTIDGVYLDSLATNPAMTYDPVANTFTPTSPFAAFIDTSFFVKITDHTNSCAPTISKWRIFHSDETEWTGAMDNDWDNYNNWSNCVPNANTNIIIPDSANYPIIRNGTAALAKSLTVRYGTQLDIESGASLTIKGSTHIGLLSEGDINNAGTITIEKTNSIGLYVVDLATFQNDGVLDIDSTRSQAIFCHGSFINETGEVHIDHAVYGLANSSSPDGALDLAGSGTFTNRGNLFFGQNGGGIWKNAINMNSSAVKLTNDGGLILIDNINGRGITCRKGKIFNSGTLHIGKNGGPNSINQNGIFIWDHAYFKNEATGWVSIDNTLYNGFLNGGSLDNYGRMDIGKLVGNIGSGNALQIWDNRSSAIITNHACATIHAVGRLDNSSGKFINDGRLILETIDPHTITDFTNNGIVNAVGSELDGVVNDDIIVQTMDASHCFTSFSPVIDFGPNVDHTIEGFYLDPAATMPASTYDAPTNTFTLNTPLAWGQDTSFFIKITDNVGGCDDIVVEWQIKQLSSTWTGAVDDDWDKDGNWTNCVPTQCTNVTIPDVANQPIIKNGTTAFSRSVAIEANAQLDIENSAALTIENAFATGLKNQGVFANAGTLFVGNAGAEGINNEGGFTNAGTGEIKVDGTGGIGLHNHTSTANVTNDGIISLGTDTPIGNTGIQNNSDASFTNATGGSITVDSVGLNGIDNLASSTFVNQGAITIEKDDRDGNFHGIAQEGASSFTNEACAELLVFNNLDLEVAAPGHFTNNGFLMLETDQAHSIEALTNNGVINAAGSPLNGVANNEITIEDPAPNTCMASYTPAFNLGSPVDFTIDGVFLNAAATMSAGTYDLPTNTFTPTTALSPGMAHTFYVKTSDTANGCGSQVSKWTIACFCSPQPTTTWTGAVNDNWDNDNNWTDCVPGTMTDVIIPNVTTDPIIKNGTAALAKSVEIIANGHLSIEDGASLAIDGSAADGLLNRGVFENGGTVNISNTGNRGLLNHASATLTNLATGEIHVTGTTEEGIHNVKTTDNHGVITINDVGDVAILNNSANSIFTNYGDITIGATLAIQRAGISNQQIGCTFINETGGSIKIDDTNAVAGIYNATATFVNKSVINIGSTKKVTGSGITNAVNNANFTNEVGAVITIDDSGGQGINASGTSFTNKGRITIGKDKPVGPNGIINTTTLFTNSPCGEIHLYDRLKNNTTFINDGFLFLETTEPHTVGTFTNNGVVNAVGSPFDVTTNNEIIVQKTTASGCTGSISPALELGSPLDFTVDGVYLDEMATTSAGSYDQATNTFQPVTAFELGTDYTFYVKITDTGNGCSSVVAKWEVSVNSGASHILYVDATTPNNNDGSDWNNAFATLEDALNEAASCSLIEEIWVADGTYYPTDGTDRTASFAMLNGIAIYGGFNGTETELSQRDWTLYPTILSGDIGTSGDASDNSYHVFFHDDNGIDATAILDGFVIKNGNADGLDEHEVGAGMFNRHVSPSVSNCVFENNTASFGGGAMYHFGGNTHIEDCTFNNNSAQIGGAAFNSDDAGAAYYMCHFNNNSATDHGGGMFNNIASVPYVENCTFDGNSADNYGGGLHNLSSSPDVMNCLFTNNTADEGAAVANQGDAADANFVNCTFSANDAGPLGGIARNFTNSEPTYTNCIFWGNASNTTGTVITDSPPGATVTYSIVEGGYPGTGNKDTNPMFVSSTDFHLEPCSPAIGSGNSSANFVSTDMDDTTRILGNIDLGVYELPTSTGTPIIWTGNGDGENWSDANNWDLGAVPQKCNDVLIPSPHVVKVQASMEGLGRTLEVELGAELVTDPDGMTNIGN